MKSRSFLEKFGFAFQGLKQTLHTETNFRIHVIFAAGAIGTLVLLKPEPIWWAVFFLIISSVLAAELFNTALESLADRVHPDLHPLIAKAKNASAAAVLVLALAALGIFSTLVYQKLSANQGKATRTTEMAQQLHDTA